MWFALMLAAPPTAFGEVQSAADREKLENFLEQMGEKVGVHATQLPRRTGKQPLTWLLCLAFADRGAERVVAPILLLHLRAEGVGYSHSSHPLLCAVRL